MVRPGHRADPAANIPPDGVAGRLVVTVGVDLATASGQVPPRAAPAGVILKLYDMNVRYTTRAAAEATRHDWSRDVD